MKEPAVHQHHSGGSALERQSLSGRDGPGVGPGGGLGGGPGGVGLGAQHGVAHGGGFELGFRLLGAWVGIEEQRGARAHLPY